MSKAYIGLGSNLHQPLMQLTQAIQTLLKHKQIELVRTSSFYQSEALILEGSPEQPDYINAVVCVKTELSPMQLLHELAKIENVQGRIRVEKWSARTLDLDILLYDDKIILTPQLIVPHPQMLKRNFVIYPLYEINPELHIPGKKTLKEYYLQLDNKGLKKLELAKEFTIAS